MAAIPVSGLSPHFHGSHLNKHSISSLPPSINPLVSTSQLYKSHKTLTSTRAVAKDDSSLSTMISKFERDVLHQQQDVEKPDKVVRGDAIDRLAERWPEIMGRDNWVGLLDPMDPLLRSELIRYGEMAQACYDAFDFDPFSRYCGWCKYSCHNFFEGLGMADAGYVVSRYLYATSNLSLPRSSIRSRWERMWSERASWIGYIAASTDEATAKLGRREIVIAWRGTVTKVEWVHDLMAILQSVREEGIPCPDPMVMVEQGFVDLYTDKDPSCSFCRYSAREQILTEIRKLVHHYTEKGDKVSITVTGHSLGSALATLSAYDIAETGLNVGVNNEEVPICVVSFSGPRVGNGRFRERFEGHGIKCIRVVNVSDTVPKTPGLFLNERLPQLVSKLADGLTSYYSHVGVELVLDHTKSPFLKETTDPGCFHNLEALLHLLDGYHGRGKKFMQATGRDPALVNKGCDFLKDEHMIPPNWWQDAYKGMTRTADGRWIRPERPRIDDHPADTDHHLEQLGLRSDQDI